MKFPVAIHKDDGTDYGVIVPDFPGCHSWGETIEQALSNTVEAVEAWVESSVENGDTVDFKPSSIEALRGNPDYDNAIWAMVDIDPTTFDMKPERVNISLPRFVLAQIDHYAESHRETRSGFLVRAALETIRDESTASHA